MARNQSEAEPTLIDSWGSASNGQKLWRVGNEYIVTSKVKSFLTVETKVFSANAKGQITSYEQLFGSKDADISHEVAIAAYYVYTRQSHLLRPL